MNPFLFDTGLPNNCAARLHLITQSRSPRILKTTQRDGLVLFHFYLVIFIIINDIMNIIIHSYLLGDYLFNISYSTVNSQSAMPCLLIVASITHSRGLLMVGVKHGLVE